MVILLPNASAEEAEKFFSASKYRVYRLHVFFSWQHVSWALGHKHGYVPFTYFPANKTLWLDESGEVQWIKY